MKTIIARGVAAAFAVIVSPAIVADSYDPTDNTISNNTHLRPGHPPVVRDLVRAGAGIADVDWYAAATSIYSSYEVVLHYAQLNLASFNLERFDGAGTVKTQDSDPWYSSTSAFASFSQVRHLRWKTTTFPGFVESFPAIKVSGDPGNVNPFPYTLQFRETTLYCARYNNAASQVTVLLMQWSPAGDFTCDYSVHFFDAPGALLATVNGTFSGISKVSPMLVLNTSTVPGVALTSGNVRIAHTCGHGGITAKTVALEPATGFSFDTPCATPDR
jgi:hypothetical protein